MNTSTLLLVVIIVFINVFSGICHVQPGNTHYIKLLQNLKSGSCTILDKYDHNRFSSRFKEDSKVFNRPIGPSSPDSKDGMNIIEVFAKSKAVADSQVSQNCNFTKDLPIISQPIQFPPPEIVKIVDGGDSLNRIDVVFMGDGYMESERTKFFEDIQRLTSDMFEGVTFKSYLPLFNIWAAYVPSPESGIGYNGPKNTPFRLYREGGQLRVIYTGAEVYARQVCAMVGPSGCDFPSIIGNDDFYGGVGGEFVISTRSLRTGTFVLRHEMGHNFVQVGDEYDNSWAYYGANSARSPATVGWSHWLSTPDQVTPGEVSIYRLLEYPWADLGNMSQLSFPFQSDGRYSRWTLTVSVSAAGESESLEFAIDGTPLPWTSSGFDDREFYNWAGNQGFLPGNHIFTVRSRTPSTNPSIPRMICSINLHEFGNESEYHVDNSFVSAYPTWDDQKRITYRPTNAGCLMRNITHNEFCSVCKEEMWIQFLSKISLIDSLHVEESPNPDGSFGIVLTTLKLGQFRAPGNEVEGESWVVQWFLGNVLQEEWNNLFAINATTGVWDVRVEFVTDEVKLDSERLLHDERRFQV